MDNIFKSKEEFEIDPNSSFNKLKKLQMALKEEVALNDIYFENRDNLLKKIDKNCYEYYQKRMSIQEIYDHGAQSLTNEDQKKITYVVSEKPQNELPQCFDPLYKLMFYFRESNELTLKLIERCKDNKDQLANFICNYFYVNIFSSTFLNENLLTLIYLLLEKDVEKLKNENSFVEFLDASQSITAIILRCLTRRDEVKTYLEKILKNLLTKTSGMLRNQKNNAFIGLDINKIKTFMKEQNYHFDRTDKDISSIKNLITANIKKSKLILYKDKIDNILRNDKSDKDNNKSDNNNGLNIKEIENNIWVQATKETFDDLLLGNNAMENEEDNSTYENKMLDKNRTKNLINKKKSQIENDDLENYFINSGYFVKKELDDIKKAKNKDGKSQRYTLCQSNFNNLNIKPNPKEYSTTAINEDDEDEYNTVGPSTSKFNRISSMNSPEKKHAKKRKFEEASEDINYLYLKELNQENILELLERQTNKDMEEYLLNQLKIIEKDGCSFSNQNLITDIIKSTNSEKSREKLALAYKYNFECVKQFIDEIFASLLNNIDNIPYIIRAICTIIYKLIKIKFPNMTTIQIIPFISEFLFSNIINHILVNPKFNGIMMFDFSKDKSIHNERNNKILSMNKVLKKLLRGQLYDSSKKNEVYYSIFNSYFIEIMPYVIEFFKNITCVKLPVNIEMLLEEKKLLKLNELNSINTSSSVALRNSLIKNLMPHSGRKITAQTLKSPISTVPQNKVSIEFNFLKMHPEERIEHQSLCFTWKDFLIIYNIIKSDEVGILGDPQGIISKTYKKMSFHEETLKKKMDKDEKEGKKTYIYMTKLIMDDKMKEKINEAKDKKFYFQESEDLSETSKENFVLKRVKYSINTIIKHLNILTRTNFYVDESESTENFIIGLNKMIRMEGFSEMLKEKTLPLEWFGLYLQSNYENIPLAYKKNNYSLLYTELIEESNANLEKIKNDDSLNIIYNKIINSEKAIDISSNGLKRITSNEKKFEIFFFILKKNIPITMVLYYNNDEKLIKIEIEKETAPVQKKNFLNIPNINFSFKQSEEENKNKDENIKKFECKNIYDFCMFFPNLISDQIKDYFKYEAELNMKSFLNECFRLINEYVIKEKMFKEYKETEKQSIQIQIENFIHAQIYNKIMSPIPDDIDYKVYETSYKLNWIKPENISPDLLYVDDKMMQIMIYFAKNMMNEMCPTNKIREFEKIDMIINNIILLYGFDNKFYNNLIMYIFIKALPEVLNSTYKYIKLYLDTDLLNQYSSLMNKIDQLIINLTKFSEKSLIGTKKR